MLTPEDITAATGLAEALRDGTYCPDPSPYHAELIEKLVTQVLAPETICRAHGRGQQMTCVACRWDAQARAAKAEQEAVGLREESEYVKARIDKALLSNTHLPFREQAVNPMFNAGETEPPKADAVTRLIDVLDEEFRQLRRNGVCRTVNLNDRVYFRLSDFGALIIGRHTQKYGEDPIDKRFPDGTARMQIWRMMEIFGPHITHAAEPVFKNNTIEIE